VGQSVAVGYERLAQGRAIHQRPGGFAIQASKTIAAPLSKVWAAVSSSELTSWAPSGRLEPSTERPEVVLRGAWRGQGESVPARFEATLAAAPNGKTRLTVVLGRLSDAEAAEAAKAAWRAALVTLKERLEE
jgi:uncharacterized protein YndB with AHSA1/START domain